MFGIHPDLRGHVMLAFVACSAVALLGLAVLVGFVADARGFRRMPAWLAIGFGVAALGVGYVGTVVVPRWHRESSHVVRSEQPIKATVTLRLVSTTESTNLYAQFQPETESPRTIDAIEVIQPRWDITPLLGRPMSVFAYKHPVSSRIVAFETTLGWLWSLPSGIRNA